MLKVVKVTKEGRLAETARHLIMDYASELKVDLNFQDLQKELEDPLIKYGPPGGALFVALYNDEPAGCIAFWPMQSGTCEMKRLYIRPVFRNKGIGNSLVDVLLNEAKTLGYKWMVLDTLKTLWSAIKLYESFGFETTAAYYYNPLPEVIYMRKQL